MIEIGEQCLAFKESCNSKNRQVRVAQRENTKSFQEGEDGIVNATLPNTEVTTNGDNYH